MSIDRHPRTLDEAFGGTSYAGYGESSIKHEWIVDMDTRLMPRTSRVSSRWIALAVAIVLLFIGGLL